MLWQVLNAELICPKQIERRKWHLSGKLTVPTTIRACREAKRQARLKLRQMERDELRSSKLRDDFLLEMEAYYSADGDKNMETIVKRIRNAEALKRAWKKIAHARGKGYHEGITNLEVPADPSVPPKQCTHWKFVEDLDAIEGHLQTHMRKHFSQAQETDFCKEPLSTDTNFSADTPTAEKILAGNHDYRRSELTLATAMLLDHMVGDKVTPITTTLTEEQFDGKLKSWNKRTSTSPSGVHLGHLKSYYAAHSLKT